MHAYFFIFLLKKVSYTRFAFHNKNSQINYTVKYIKKNMKDLQINSKGPTNIFEIFWYYKEAHWLDIKIKKGENKGVKHKGVFCKTHP